MELIVIKKNVYIVKMIVLYKDTVNESVFTLKEKTTIAPVFYIIVIHSNQTKENKVMYLGIDQSPNVDRWNQFDIEEVPLVDEDLADTKINLVTGTYDYYVWQSTSDDLTLIDAVSVVESGKLIVNGTTPTIYTIDTPQDYYVIE